MDIIIRQVMPEDLDAVARVEAVCFPEAEAASRASLHSGLRHSRRAFWWLNRREGSSVLSMAV